MLNVKTDIIDNYLTPLLIMIQFCVFSDNIFSGYKVSIDVKENKITENELIEYCFTDLLNHLKKYNFDMLISEINKRKKLFHIHGNLKEMLNNNYVIYICSHIADK